MRRVCQACRGEPPAASCSLHCWPTSVIRWGRQLTMRMQTPDRKKKPVQGQKTNSILHSLVGIARGSTYSHGAPYCVLRTLSTPYWHAELRQGANAISARWSNFFLFHLPGAATSVESPAPKRLHPPGGAAPPCHPPISK